VTLGEKITILLGLAAGYWLVSAIMDWSARKERAEAAQSQGGQQSKQERIAASDPGGPTARWFEVLEVSESATAEQITAAYKKKISENHPDKVAQMGEEIRALAELRSQQINAAYDYALKLKA
jgi:DnaJ-domain-containing protein 1